MHTCLRNARINPVRPKELKSTVLELGWNLKKGDRFLKEEGLRGGSASQYNNLLKNACKKIQANRDERF